MLKHDDVYTYWYMSITYWYMSMVIRDGALQFVLRCILRDATILNKCHGTTETIFMS
jgi:hypothetical protein